jgi:hypothetical protein
VFSSLEDRQVGLVILLRVPFLLALHAPITGCKLLFSIAKFYAYTDRGDQQNVLIMRMLS